MNAKLYFIKLHLLLILNTIFNYFFRNFIIYNFSSIFHTKIVSWMYPFFNFFYKKSNSSPTCRSRRLLAIFLLNYTSYLNMFVFQTFQYKLTLSISISKLLAKIILTLEKFLIFLPTFQNLKSLLKNCLIRQS